MPEIEKLSDDELLGDFARKVGQVLQKHAAEIRAIRAELGHMQRTLCGMTGVDFVLPQPDPEAMRKAAAEIAELEKLFNGEGQADA
jgi:hypothetical protein